MAAPSWHTHTHPVKETTIMKSSCTFSDVFSILFLLHKIKNLPCRLEFLNTFVTAVSQEFSECDFFSSKHFSLSLKLASTALMSFFTAPFWEHTCFLYFFFPALDLRPDPLLQKNQSDSRSSSEWEWGGGQKGVYRVETVHALAGQLLLHLSLPQTELFPIPWSQMKQSWLLPELSKHTHKQINHVT